MKKLRKVGLLILSTILLLLVVGFFALTSTPPFNKSAGTPTHINLKNLTVWHIGSSNVILDEVLERMQLLGVLQVRHLGMQEFFLNDTPISMDVNELSLVIFDGDQISERVGNPEIHGFLREASYKRAKLAAIGGLTSKFFEALDRAGVNELGRDEAGTVRNPVYFNPPLVGFKLEQASTPDGHPYFYPSIFSSSTGNVDAMVYALINWL